MKLELQDLYQVAPDEVQAQYRDGNIKELIQGISDIKKKYIKKAFESLKNDNLLITTAKQDGLDMWGRLIHFYRHVPADLYNDSGIRYFNFNDKNFRRLQFINPDEPNYGRLPDDVFRRMIVLIYQGMFINNTIPSLNTFVNQFFSEFDKIVVRDTLDMSFVVYVFKGNNPMPGWLNWILSNYDLLPRPAGVGSSYIEATGYKIFGFAPDGTTDEWYFKNIGNFGTSNFKK